MSKLAVQLVSTPTSSVADGSFASIAQVREESNASLFSCDRNSALKAEMLQQLASGRELFRGLLGGEMPLLFWPATAMRFFIFDDGEAQKG